MGFCCMAFVLVLGACNPPKYPACENDDHCKDKKEFCVNKLCQQCRDSKDCKPGESCKAGRCEPNKTACTDDTQCPDGQSCIDGFCKPCVDDGQCGPGGKCNGGKCARASSEIDPNGNTPPPTQCTCDVIYFDFNESNLSNEATSGIEKNAECMKKVGTRAVGLAGYTDPRGTEEYNLALSDKRAQSVKDRMVRLGVDAGRLRIVPKGETEAMGADERGWAKDRKVECQW
jgi:peptidoglycan-associated lipoprotein